MQRCQVLRSMRSLSRVVVWPASSSTMNVCTRRMIHVSPMMLKDDFTTKRIVGQRSKKSSTTTTSTTTTTTTSAEEIPVADGLSPPKHRNNTQPSTPSASTSVSKLDDVAASEMISRRATRATSRRRRAAVSVDVEDASSAVAAATTRPRRRGAASNRSADDAFTANNNNNNSSSQASSPPSSSSAPKSATSKKPRGRREAAKKPTTTTAATSSPSSTSLVEERVALADPIYITEARATMTANLSEQEILAERASITKLFMVSDSVSFIFSALPQQQRSINQYLHSLDRAVPPNTEGWLSQRGFPRRGGGGGIAPRRTSSSSSSMRWKDDDDGRVSTEEELAERVLAEERADHALCIHVRDMEQLNPPEHLLRRVNAPSAIITRRGRRKKTNNNNANTQSSSSPSTQARRRGASSSLVEQDAQKEVERIKALQAWQQHAVERSRLSEHFYTNFDLCHVITRVRGHGALKTDFTVVEGSGQRKSVESVFASMDRSLVELRSHRRRHGNTSSDGVGDEDAHQHASAFATSLPRDVEQSLYSTAELAMEGSMRSDGVARVSSSSFGSRYTSSLQPYAFKPLLTIHATCIPRRDPYLGIRKEEDVQQRDDDADVDRHRHHDAPTYIHWRDDSTTSAADAESTSSVAPDGDDEDAASSSIAGAVGTSTWKPSAIAANPLTDEEVYAIIQSRSIPSPMPRHMTRLTLLVEHNRMEPTDLLSLAEISSIPKSKTVTPSTSPTKDATSSSSSATATSDASLHRRASMADRAGIRLYCLIVDGGQV